MAKKVDQITLVYHFCFLLPSKKRFAYILGSLSQPHSQASVCGSPGTRLHSAIPQNEGLILCPSNFNPLLLKIPQILDLIVLYIQFSSLTGKYL